MLLERCQAGAAVCVSKMAAKADIEEADIHAAEDDNKLDTTSDLVKDTQSQGPSKVAEAFEVDFGESMPENSAKNLQEAFKNFKKLRQVGAMFWSESRSAQCVCPVGLKFFRSVEI